jgi:hypothetical protein
MVVVPVLFKTGGETVTVPSDKYFAMLLVTTWSEYRKSVEVLIYWIFLTLRVSAEVKEEVG